MDESYLYESELEEILLEQSRKQYGIQEITQLIPYLFRRCLIVGLDNLKIKKISKDDFPAHFMNFWLQDLAIPIHNRTFIYQGIPFSTSVTYGSPLKNIYDDLLHQYETSLILSGEHPNMKEIWSFVKEEVSRWLKEAKTKSKKYRNEAIYHFVVKKILLQKLNDSYRAKVTFPSNLKDFRYIELSFKLSEEEICERHILAFHERVTNGELLAENELEQYVMAHLEDIETGLCPVQSQFILPYGRIDILAKDKEGTYVIIELKVEKDTDIVWQKWYYTNEIKSRYQQEQVRFMVILPQFYEEIIEPLFQDDTPTTILQFHPTIQRGKLLEASFTPLENSERIIS